ncbi:hypothetical protein GWK47_017359 [Chionoecetes opilio]|uniref:Uncharacterized protein n=1 Tax=Chionoecetes opilio TaxID=41210 RepID=A0A8J4XVZ4_CHIOP|nr:hypothetical protein GWK47_017359 [Chionoecetes opilio]
MAAILRWSRVPKWPSLPPCRPSLRFTTPNRPLPPVRPRRCAPLRLQRSRPGLPILSFCFGTTHLCLKLRWLSEVNGAFHLDRDQAEVKMAAITSRFVYISHHRPDIVTSVTNGEFLSLPLEIQDSPDRPRKFPTYLLTRYPVCSDPAWPRSAGRLLGSPLSKTRRARLLTVLGVTWSLPQPPPPSVAFSFLPSLPSCEFRRMKDEQPWCFRCWGFGHISRYCFAAERCAWCSGPHDSRSCPHRAPPPAAPASDSASTPPQVSPPHTSLWECPRCHQAGVNVWHGCARRQTVAAPAATTIPQLAPPPPPPRSAPPLPYLPLRFSPQVTALSILFAPLQSRIASLEAAIDGVEARLESFG